MRTRTTAAALLAAACLTLTACSSTDNAKDAKPKASASELTQKQKDDISKAAGIPPKPTGAEREKLLRALRTAAPDAVRYEDKAIDAARNQCMAINNGAKRLDWSAAQRFTYKDVTTSEEQGKAINDALRSVGYCKS